MDELLWLRLPGYETAIIAKEEVASFTFLDKQSQETASFVKTKIKGIM